jgi:very-short-patch-repair endonuclease
MSQNSENKPIKPRWLTASKSFYPTYKYERNRLKQNMTPAEVKLWDYLRNKKLGVKFRRQHIIEFYIPDFVSLPIKLIVEIDGKIHLKQNKEDAERTRRLELIGYRVIRFTNEEVEKNIDEVLTVIKKNIEELKDN